MHVLSPEHRFGAMPHHNWVMPPSTIYSEPVTNNASLDN